MAKATKNKPASGSCKIETLLLEQGLVTDEQLTRAERITSKLKEPKPLGEVLVELGQLAQSDYDRVLQLHRSRQDLVGILRDEGSLSEENLAILQKLQSEHPERTPRQILLDKNLVSEKQFLSAISIKHGIPCVKPEAALVDEKLLAKTSFPYLKRNNVLPVRMIDGKLTVILADPKNVVIIQELERIFEVRITVNSAPTDEIQEALEKLERIKEKGGGKQNASIQYREIEEVEDGDEIGEEAVQLVDFLFCRAIEIGASDLHIEPKARKLTVRARVDGVIQPLVELAPDLAPRIVSRVKILAGADIAERRRHQDGRIFLRIEGRDVDIRVSTYASMYGETLVLRLLDRNKGLVGLNDLGFEPMIKNALRDLVLRTSSGLVMVTGPTGSGKTTTLYSFIDHIMNPSLKVISCEDPVEYVLDDAVQCSVNEKSGPTFADSLRAILRQDPDIIVVGEIRDKKTASLAVEAALTGHKVYSTFHTEDAVSAVVRLLEMGLEPFLVASTLNCIVAQRLVRRMCRKCLQEGSLSRKDLRFLGLQKNDLAGTKIMAGAGCSHCGETGFQGRMGVHEVLLPDDDFRDAILRRASSKELRELARRLPCFLTLQEDGLLKVAAGGTTAGEIADNVPRDQDSRPLATLKEIAELRSSI